MDCWWLAVLMIVFAGHANQAAAQTAMLYTLVTNGPATNRLNIVIFSEGYTTEDLTNRFLSDATNVFENFFPFEPYAEYQNYINVYAVAVPSSISGSTHLDNTTFVRNATYFNSTFDVTWDRIVTIPPYNLDTTAADGMGKVTALLKSLLPNVLTNSVLPVLLVNAPSYDGGSGGPISINTTKPSTLESISMHETGHTLAQLGDEYNYGYTDVLLNTSLEANTTATTNLQTLKWKAWVQPGTPIPTEEADDRYAGVVGVFRGGDYTTNDFHPALYCRMLAPFDDNNNPTSFCPVCREAMLLAIYKRARPIDSFSPATNKAVSITNSGAMTFSVVPLQPMTHDLNVQWYANGTAIADATNAFYSLAPLSFTNGTYTLKALVTDPTPFILAADDPSNLVSASVSWTITNAIKVLTIDSVQWLPNNRFTFRLSGRAANGFVVQSSTNLVNWTSLSTNTLTAGQYYYTNSGLAGTSGKFYRALLK